MVECSKCQHKLQPDYFIIQKKYEKIRPPKKIDKYEKYEKIHTTNDFYEQFELSQQIQIGYALIKKEIEEMHNNFEKNIERIRREW
jgi:hypothetical protein